MYPNAGRQRTNKRMNNNELCIPIAPRAESDGGKENKSIRKITKPINEIIIHIAGRNS
jgi:hypothetical protein